MGMVLAGSFNYVYNNYIQNVHNGVLGATQWFYSNTIRHVNGSFDATSHGNVFRVTVGCTTNAWNNWTDDASGGATYFPDPVLSSGANFYFNNLDTNDQNQAIQIASNLCGVSCAGTSMIISNNVIQEKASVVLRSHQRTGRRGWAIPPDDDDQQQHAAAGPAQQLHRLGPHHHAELCDQYHSEQYRRDQLKVIPAKPRPTGTRRRMDPAETVGVGTE